MKIIKTEAPCLNCTERVIGCHDYCEKYGEFRAEVKLEHRKYIDDTRDDRLYTAYRAERKYKK